MKLYNTNKDKLLDYYFYKNYCKILIGEYMKKYLTIKNIILLLLSLIIIVFVYNYYFIYKTVILKVNNVKNVVVGYGSNNAKYYNQKISGIIKNGKYKDKKITINNDASTSGVSDEMIHKRSELFIKKSANTYTIIGIKRDKYIAILFILFIDLIIFVSGRQGIKTLISLIVNILISGFAIFIFNSSSERLNLLVLYMFISIVFIVSSHLITNGKSAKTFSAIISSIISLFVSFGLEYLIINVNGKSVTIWTMDYIEYVRDYENYFYVCILLSGLGAIMDISITISSSLNELINKDNNITKRKLLKSGREISKDIIGTMSNVMLYTCFAPTIPLIFLALKNNMPLARAINYYGEIELIIILCSCISIVLAIPISLYTSVYLLKGNKKEGIK